VGRDLQRDDNNISIADNNAPNELVTVSPAIPTLTTTPKPATITLGTTPVTLKDTADLEAGYLPAGTITFTLFHNGGATPVDTETVSVNGNGTYTTPNGFTLPTSGTVTGTYQWDATYNGDDNNKAGSDNSAANEQVTVSAANPTLTTKPNQITVMLGPGTVTLTDTATLSGGYSPTGTITFMLFHNGGTTPVDTETVAVTGNGTYLTPTGFTLPTTGTVTGTYQWDATYNGDTNNNPVSDNSAANEQVTVSVASPTLTTTPNPLNVTLSMAATTLKDTADLEGGYNPTGTITFTLFYNGGTTPVDTETVTVNGNGMYTTPTGFTLPTTGTVVGTYQWDATYNGDPNNNAVSDNNDTAERVTVTAASPTISTTPIPATVTLGANTTTLTDTAILAGGANPTGIITFTLFYNGSTTAADTETVTVNGNGTYTTPTGFTLPTSGTVTGSYQWDATYNGDSNNSAASDNNDPIELVTVTAATPTLDTTPNPATVILDSTSQTLKDTADLEGGFNPTGSITFTLFRTGSTVPLDTETVTVNANGTYATPSGFTLPTTATVTGSYQWDATYKGDGNNITVNENNHPTEQVTVDAASPTLKTTPVPATVTLGTTSQLLKDSADLEGGFNPAGTITFTLFKNGGTTSLDTETVTVNGNGTYTTPTGFTLPTTGTVAGTYQWDATYSGNGNNNAVSENNKPTEHVTVSAANPSLTTTPDPATVALDPASHTLKDTAHLLGGFNPTGTITFMLFYNGGATPVDTETVTVNGNGNYTTPTGSTLLTAGPVTGTYQWVATYGGDANNNMASDGNATTERVTVGAANPALVTTPTPDVVSPGAVLKDSALLTRGYQPTGIITFTLFFNGGATPVDTETVTVNGNGTYTTPTGFTVSTNGTYQWDATYSGDGNNITVSDVNDPNEQVTPTPPNLTITTVPSPTTIPLGDTAPPILTDTAVLNGGFAATGTITFTLFYSGGTTPVDTETVTVNGDGSYATPTGFTLPTTGTVTGTYQWDAAYSGDSNNNPVSDVGNPNEQVTVTPAGPTLSTNPSPDTVTLDANSVTLTDMAILAGGFNPTGTITFSLFHNGDTTPVETETVSVTGNGAYTTPTGLTLPSTGTVTGTYQWDANYSGDGNNITVNDNNDPTERVTVDPATPTLNTTPSLPTVALNATSVTLKDTADLEGGFNPTGSITLRCFTTAARRLWIPRRLQSPATAPTRRRPASLFRALERSPARTSGTPPIAATAITLPSATTTTPPSK
jgi:hypothetical protein